MSTLGRISSLDKELLDILERSFDQHADGGVWIDAAALQRALGLKSEYLARQVLRLFDSDGNGRVDAAEFLSAVRKLVLGSESDKLRFAFRLHDDDDDGFISYTEMLRMISIALAEGDIVSRQSQPPERLASVLLRAADRDGDGRISFDEFAEIMTRYPELLRNMTRSEALWISPSEELLQQMSNTPKDDRSGLRRLLQNRLFDGTFLMLWIVVNVGLLIYGLWSAGIYDSSNVWVRAGYALGACLNFNGALIFVPILRGLFTRIRRTRLGQKLDVDRAVDFHRWVGQLLFALSLAHATAFIAAYAEGHSTHSVFQIAQTYYGATGLLLLLVLGVMWMFAQDRVRRSQHFELFYFTHLLYVLWVVIMIAHSPSFVAWGVVPLAIVVVERLRRWRRRSRVTVVESASALRSGVVRLQFKRPHGFSFQAGDYVFLNIPHIARREWHPFTISSAPEQEAMTVHVRSLGNWTSALRQDIERREIDGDLLPFPARIDGPYGTPSARIFASTHAVLIGAGIGVTPFASVLESIALRTYGTSNLPCKLQHVHFFWLNRDQYSFEWFRHLLSQLEAEDKQEMLDIHVCMTRGHTGASAVGLEVAREILQGETHRDLITGLRTKTHMGHPDWDLVLAAIAEEHGAKQVDVFFCGPPGLGMRLREICDRLGMRFHEEKF